MHSKKYGHLTVAIVGHISIENLNHLKQTLDELDYFKIIFFKTSSSKLWIKEGETRDDR